MRRRVAGVRSARASAGFAVGSVFARTFASDALASQIASHCSQRRHGLPAWPRPRWHATSWSRWCLGPVISIATMSSRAHWRSSSPRSISRRAAGSAARIGSKGVGTCGLRPMGLTGNDALGADLALGCAIRWRPARPSALGLLRRDLSRLRPELRPDEGSESTEQLAIAPGLALQTGASCHSTFLSGAPFQGLGMRPRTAASSSTSPAFGAFNARSSHSSQAAPQRGPTRSACA